MNIEISTVGGYPDDIQNIQTLQQLFEAAVKRAHGKIRSLILMKNGKDLEATVVRDDNDVINLLTGGSTALWEEYAEKLTAQNLNHLLSNIYQYAKKSELSKSDFDIVHKK